MTNGDRHRRPDVGYAASEGIGALLGVSRHPHDVTRLLGSLAQGGAQSVRPFGGLFAVVHFHQVLADGILQGSRAQVRVGELMRLGPGPQPDFGNVKAHHLAARRQYTLDAGTGLLDEAILVEALFAPENRNRIIVRIRPSS